MTWNNCPVFYSSQFNYGNFPQPENDHLAILNALAVWSLMLLQNWVGDLPAEQLEEMESGARSGWPVCPRSRQQSKVSHGWRNARLGEVSTGRPWFPWSSAENISLMTSLSHLWKVLGLPDQRVPRDYISYKGTEHRQPLLLIFNTKSQGNGKERLRYYHRYRGMVELSTSASQLSNAFFFSSLLELSKVLETFFLSPEKWFGLQRDKCTEWHFIFWFLFSTDKPKGIGGHSSSWGNRNSLWSLPLALARRHARCSTCPVREPADSAAQRSGLPESIATRGVSLRFQSLILGFAGSNNPLSL